MSSREIAELTNKRHDHVIRDCEVLNENYANLGFPKLGEGYYTHPKTGSQQHREMYLTKMQTFDLLTGYDVVLRSKIINRWEELEKKEQERQAQPQIDFSNPDTILMLAQNWKAEQDKRIALEKETETNDVKLTGELQLFNNPEFGSVRIVTNNDNEPLFCLSDVCRALELSVKGVNQRLTKEVISNYPLQTSGGLQQALFVNEDGLYDVILDSRKPEAKKFRKWVTSEVLPSIRKNGAYMTESTIEKALTSPDFLIQLATTLKEEQTKRLALEKENIS